MCQWLLNNHASHFWIIVPVNVEQSCQWLLNNGASGCWTMVPVAVEESYQLLLNNPASDCWTIVPVTVEQSCCSTFVPVTVDELCQCCWRIVLVTVEHNSELLNNRASDSWWIVPTAVEQSCQLFFSLFLTYFFRVNTSIIINYFNSGSQLSKLQQIFCMITMADMHKMQSQWEKAQPYIRIFLKLRHHPTVSK